MMILDVHDRDDGAILELGPPARLGHRLVLLEGCWRAVDVTTEPAPWTSADDAQAQADIGDDLYERSRYDDREIDIVADEPEFPWRPER